MLATDRSAPRGSWNWVLGVAEVTAWAATLLTLVIVVVEPLRGTRHWAALGLCTVQILWVFALFRWLLPRARRRSAVGIACAAGSTVLALSFFALLRYEIPSIQLLLVPVVMVTGLLGRRRDAAVAAAMAIGGYLAVAAATGGLPSAGTTLLNSALYALSAMVAAVLARELRAHYLGEKEEHRVATAVRHRLTAVLDSIDEAVVFRDRAGVLRVVNRRAAQLFGLRPEDYLDGPGVELLRALARLTEDPEGFMEAFQELREDPTHELRMEVEQILPERRQLRMYSGPAFDENGELVGRIEVYTDITQTVRRAAEIERLYEQARKTAESYQRSLLPEALPTLPRFSVVARYVPAAGSRAVCGDFYDFVQLPDGRVGIVVGDVVGIGPVAANSAALARYTMRTFAAHHSSPSELMSLMNVHVHAQIDPDRFIRMLFGALDPERATLEYVNAGHVPPVVYRASSGDVEWLAEGGVALGVEPDSDYKAARVELEPGDMLVLYTDGVTEAARRGRPFGQARFADLVRLYGAGTPGELVQAIGRSVDAWVGGEELRDDLALLVCQVVPDTTLAEPERELVLPNEPARLGEVRAFVADFLSDARVPVEVSQDIVLAAGEAAGNATRHGRRPEGRSEMRVACRLEGDEVVVTVADDGPGFDVSEVPGRGPPDRFASGGRGLFLMRQLMDDVVIDSSPAGTKVVLRRKVGVPAGLVAPAAGRDT